MTEEHAWAGSGSGSGDAVPDLVLRTGPGVVYEAAVRQAAPSSDSVYAASALAWADVAPGAPLGRSDFETIVWILGSRGLVDASDPTAWEVPSPAHSMSTYASDLEALARLARTRSHELAHLYRIARTDSGPHQGDDVQLLMTVHEIGMATDEITRGARREIAVMRDLTRRSFEIFEAPEHAHAEPHRGGDGEEVPSVGLYDTGLLGHPCALDLLRARNASGEDVRIAADVPFSVVVVDDTAAIIDVSHADSPEGEPVGVLLRVPTVAAALGRLVRSRHQAATPLPAPGVEDGTTACDPQTVLILRLLAAGASDSTIARQLGVSVRTVERRLRSVMDTLGATSSFQAGAIAARDGLV